MAKRNETNAGKARAAAKAGKAAPPVRVSRAKPAKPATVQGPDYSMFDATVVRLETLKSGLESERVSMVGIIGALVKGAADINAAVHDILKPQGRFAAVFVAAYMARVTGTDHTVEEGAKICAKAGAASQDADRRTAIMEKACGAARTEAWRIRKMGGWDATDTRGGANGGAAGKAAKAAAKRGTKARNDTPSAKAEPVMPAAASIGNSVELATSLLFHAKACMDLINAKPKLGLNPWVGDVHTLINHLKGFLAQNKG